MSSHSIMFMLVRTKILVAWLCAACTAAQPLDTVKPWRVRETKINTTFAEGDLLFRKADPHGPVAQTTLGPVLGRWHAGVSQYLGIPYGYASERFAIASPWTEPWSPYFYNARHYRPACIQPVPAPDWETYKGANGYSEACLYINIYAPEGSKPGTLPVMAWLHGGGNLYGSASSVEYNGTVLAAEQNVIVVAIEYRLGVFGQFASDDIAWENPQFPTSGGMNYLLDQRAALQWIQSNIHGFGGDPARVTIWGESAGGVSVCNLLASAIFEGLFVRAIIESGPCNGPWGPHTRDYGVEESAACMAAVECSSLWCLREVPADTLMNTDECLGVYISVDGMVLSENPAKLLHRGVLSLPPAQPLLLGFNTGDTLLGNPFFASGRSFLHMNAASYTKLIKGYFPEAHRSILARYPPLGTNADTVKQFLYMNSDLCVKCPLQYLAQEVAGPAGAKRAVYMYSYGYQPHSNTRDGVYEGFAAHAAEVSMVFGNRNKVTPYNEYLSKEMRSYWAGYARNGIPTGASQWSPKWAPYNPVNAVGPGLNLTVPLKPAMFDEYRADRCALWEDMTAGTVDNDKVFAFCNQLGYEGIEPHPVRIYN